MTNNLFNLQQSFFVSVMISLHGYSMEYLQPSFQLLPISNADLKELIGVDVENLKNNLPQVRLENPVVDKIMKILLDKFDQNKEEHTEIISNIIVDVQEYFANNSFEMIKLIISQENS